ncbi:STAS/SEC14 domain-containing protein [Salinisphaera sp. Q1T1-3]|uniref:STAS/SEC14 domain-containing protein n=1 Tax=Salinisphaera sp. Q1T1-3 TaxID=2321229 RepID=UPI000E71528A|nr:STAS/SEC14 domain-containing protein [Salinisphaera sp. Q1T1-3]RJS94766.1 STAS/SEC14 domain-containing protein [Salinisphaera sp. Q1T1-3]
MLRLAPFKSDADHVVALEIDGAIGAQDFTNIVSTINDRLEQHDSLRLYIELKSLGGMAVTDTFDQIRDAIGHWNRFDKLAVVTDIDGVRTATSVLDKLAPKMACQTYRFDARESAQQWVIA